MNARARVTVRGLAVIGALIGARGPMSEPQWPW
jgi:hypothetical protein